MDGLNVVLVSYEFPPVIGGEGVYTYRLAEFLAKTGCRVTVITSGREEKTDKSNFGVIRVPSSESGLKLYSFDKIARKIIKDISEQQGIDIIHYTNDVMHLSNCCFDAPVIATVHHPWADERDFFKHHVNFVEYFKYAWGKKIFYLEWLEKNISRRSDKIIAVSNYTARSIIGKYRIPPEKITVIPNAVDTENFNPDISGEMIRKKFDIQSGPVILYVGKLDFHKGVEYLIFAFSRIMSYFPDSRLLIVGGGPVGNNLEELCKKCGLGDSVIFAGRVPDEDLPHYYAASDLFVLPSLMEGFGIVLLEAMSCGLACIAARSGGVEDVIVNNETGLLVPPADPESLYRAIFSVLSNSSILLKFGRQGRKRVLDNFTMENIARQTLDVYKSML